MALTPKQQAFVDAYEGNGTAAARAAGYKGDDNSLGVQAHNLLRLPKIVEAIARRNVLVTAARTEAQIQAGRIASRAERQAFWTEVMFDRGSEMNERLKASELLGKSEADFTDKLKVSGNMALNIIDPYATPKGE